MTTPKPEASKILFTVSGGETKLGKLDYPLPALLRIATRGGGTELDPLLAGIRVEHRYELAATTHGEAKTLNTGKEDVVTGFNLAY